MNLKKTVKLWWPAVLWMGLIFAGSSLPSARVSQNRLVDFLVHKAVHLFEYGILTLLLFRATSSWVVSLVLASLFGAGDEWHQTFVPGRRGRLRDWLVDLLGIAFGLGSVKIAQVRSPCRARRRRADGIVTHSARETREAAKKWLSTIERGEVLALYGDVGSGKTTFVAGLAKALGVKERATSPSFVLVKEYKTESDVIRKLVHVDLYRLRSEDEVSGLGLGEKFSESDALVVIEWADRLGKGLPARARRIFFAYLDEKSRRLRFG